MKVRQFTTIAASGIDQRAAMKRMAASNALIVGMNGLGVEIGTPYIYNISRFSFIFGSAKNIVLAGVKSVSIFDPETVKIQDLSTQVSTACSHTTRSKQL